MKRINRRSKQINGVFMGARFVCMLTFCCFLVWTVSLFSTYYYGQKEYENVLRKATGMKTDDTAGVDDSEDNFQVDFSCLLKQNPDTVAWIRFPQEPSKISYPVMQTKDNQTYLHQTFLGEENPAGAIFMDTDNRADFSDTNTIIYGHRMKDGSMFRGLVSYEDPAFREQNPFFYIYTANGVRRKYEIYAVSRVTDGSWAYQKTFGNAREKEEFLVKTVKESLYATSSEVEWTDQIVTLSTCTGSGDDGRLVVRGILRETR